MRPSAHHAGNTATTPPRPHGHSCTLPSQPARSSAPLAVSGALLRSGGAAYSALGSTVAFEAVFAFSSTSVASVPR